MDIELSAKEYRDLLDILHIADVVLSGHRREPDKRSERHRALIQKLYALVGGEGLDRLISYNESVHKLAIPRSLLRGHIIEGRVRETAGFSVEQSSFIPRQLAGVLTLPIKPT